MLANPRTILRPARQLLRQAGRRHESTAAETAKDKAAQVASSAKATASTVTSKASEGLSKVQASGSEALSKAGSAAGAAASRGSSLLARIQGVVPPTIYYSKVGLELSKLVFQGQKMYPPSVSQFQTYLQPLIRNLRNPSALLSQSQTLFQPAQLLQSVRNVSTQQLVSGGVIAAELLGFFTVGEMLGKLKIVGYRGGVEHH